jgi:hypothetical protein
MTTDGKDIRRLLDKVDLPGPRIDLGEVARDGERLRRRRRARAAVGSAVVGLVVAVAAVPLALHFPVAATVPNAAATGKPIGIPSGSPTGSPIATATAGPTPAASCAVGVLALPPGVKNYQTEAMDPTGRYVVGWASSNTVYATMFWDNGAAQDMHVPGTPGVSAVNSHGVVAGSTSTQGFDDERVYRWANGSTTILSYPMPGRWHPYSIYIDDDGAIIANAEPENESGGVGSVTVLFRPGTTRGVKLPIPSGSEVFGISDSGLIVGTLDLTLSASEQRGAVWDLNGTLLRKLSFSSYVDRLSPTGDLAAGSRFDANTHRRVSSFLWNLRTGEVIELGARVTQPLAVNAQGWVLDSVIGVVKGDNVVALPPLQPGDGTRVSWAAMADNGTVVGQSMSAIGDASLSTPLEWHC